MAAEASNSQAYGSSDHATKDTTAGAQHSTTEEDMHDGALTDVELADNGEKNVTPDAESESSNPSKMHAFEIEGQRSSYLSDGKRVASVDSEDADFVAEDSDFERLLATTDSASPRKATATLKPQSTRVGNSVIFWPTMHTKTGWGIAGPHWFGPPCVAAVVLGSSKHFIHSSFVRIGPISAAICVLFTVATLYHLLNTCYRNPGIVTPLRSSDEFEEDDDEMEMPAPPSPQHRWCTLCKAYQPPRGAHCPDCNVCVAGYDHHCVWMGCCIGQANYKPFMRFNMTWVLYLMYAVVWVTVVGPLLFRHQHDDAHRDATEPPSPEMEPEKDFPFPVDATGNETLP